MLEDERNLIARAKGGEAEAFGSLYDFYMPRIYRFVLLKVSRREEAEDLTHQVFLKAWERIDQYGHRGYPFGSWLYRIARNAVIDYHRGKPSDVSIDYVPPELLALDNTLDRKIDAEMEWRELLDSIRKLKDVEQDVLIMRFVEELPHKEIAKAIGKSEGAVKVIQHRALKSLKQLIDND